MAKKKQFKQLALPGMPRPRDIMTPQARYRRGYTPERQKEILSALHGVDITHDQGTEAKDRKGTGTDPEWLPHDEVTPKIRKAQQGIAKDHVVRMLSNSSISPNQLEGLTSIRTFTGEIPGAPEDVDGVYHDPDLCKFNASRGRPCSIHGLGGDNKFLALAHSVGLPGDHPVIANRKNAAKSLQKMGVLTSKEALEGNDTALNRMNITGNTLIHELGHHVQDRMSPFKEGDPAHRGFMEASADNYAAEMTGKQFKDKREHKGSHSYPGLIVSLVMNHKENQSKITNIQEAVHIHNWARFAEGYLTHVKLHSGERHKEELRKAEAAATDHNTFINKDTLIDSPLGNLVDVFRGAPKQSAKQLSFDGDDDTHENPWREVTPSVHVRTRKSNAQKQKELDSEEEIDPSINIRNR